MTVAVKLKEVREKKGLTLQSVARSICVRESYLAAIEADDVDKLPESPFAVGFVRSYARHLGLNEDEVTAAFKSQHAMNEPLRIEVPDYVVKKSTPAWVAPLVGGFGVLAVWFMAGGQFGQHSRMVTDAPAPQYLADTSDNNGRAGADSAADQADRGDGIEADSNITVSMFSQTTGTSLRDVQLLDTPKQGYGLQDAGERANRMGLFPAAHADVQSAVTAKGAMILHARDDAWLRLANEDGSEIWAGLLQAGESYRPEVSGRILLTVSDGNAIQVELKDSLIQRLGGRGEIVESMPIETD